MVVTEEGMVISSRLEHPAKAEAPSEKSDAAKKADDADKPDTKKKVDPSVPNPAVLPDAPAPVLTGESVTCEEAEGCECGETKCPMNAVCTDGVCRCGNTLVESYYTGYACFEIAKGVYDLGCTESEGCPCGKIKVYSNMGCSGTFGTCAGTPVPGRGLSCRHKPYKDKFYSLGCFKDECDCYGETIHKDEICEPLACTNGFKATPQGCTCDGRKYEEGYICVPGRDQRLVNYCTDKEIQPYIIPSSYEIFCNGAMLQKIDDVPVFRPKSLRLSVEQRAVKRTVDIILAGIAAICALPFAIPVALAIKLGDGGPILYSQVRVGRFGKEYKDYKFRFC